MSLFFSKDEWWRRLFKTSMSCVSSFFEWYRITEVRRHFAVVNGKWDTFFMFKTWSHTIRFERHLFVIWWNMNENILIIHMSSGKIIMMSFKWQNSFFGIHMKIFCFLSFREYQSNGQGFLRLGKHNNNLGKEIHVAWISMRTSSGRLSHHRQPKAPWITRNTTFFRMFTKKKRVAAKR